MLRYAFILTLSLGGAAGVAAAVEAGSARFGQERTIAASQTVIEKNSAFPVLGPLTFAPCEKEDCSDVQS